LRYNECEEWCVREVSIETYRVALDVFEGPLELLLRLIEHQELDITKVSLALVADQYLAHIADLHEIPAASLADFLVIAAKLLAIKSRSLLPHVEDVEEEDEEDPGEELARQLLEYRRYKEAAAKLRQVEELALHCYPRVAPLPQPERRLQPGEVTLAELLRAFERALEAHPPVPPVDQVVAPVKIHIGDWIKTISRMVRRYPKVRFSTLMRRVHTRLEVIVTFMAILEMLKQQRLRVTQEELFGEIYLEERQPDPGIEITPTDLSEYGEL
jgi:segregation and condensation protein A